MVRSNDLVELTLLYDTARGFLAARTPESTLRHALLAVMGICGAATGALLTCRREGDAPEVISCGISTSQVEGLWGRPALHEALRRDPGPLLADSDLFTDPGFRGECRGLGIDLLHGLRSGGRIHGLICLGSRLMGTELTEGDRAVTREFIELVELALGSWWITGESVNGTVPGTPESNRRGDAAETARHRIDRLGALRAAYPVLESIRGEGPATLTLFEEIVQLADFGLPILIAGETGVGKELVARALHHVSRRAGQPFLAVNCAAHPKDLIASELFGHERGAFTSAVSRTGILERVEEGTVFLDEIGDMPLEAQALLLRVLQEREFCRVGGNHPLPLRARVISATYRQLEDDVAAGRFRVDLFFRIRMSMIDVPPLRQRPEEIPVFVRWLIEQQVLPGGHPALAASPEFLSDLMGRDLPGNFREVESLVHQAIHRAAGGSILRPEHLPARGAWRSREIETGMAPADESPPASIPRFDENQREYILGVLRQAGGNVKEAARLMGIPRTTLVSRMEKLEIRRADFGCARG